MNRQDLLKLWNEHHASNTWVTGASKAVGGLTPEQAAWKPDPQRHSIWQLVNHLIFWHDYHLDRKRGAPNLPADEVARRNWEEPGSVSDAAWREAVSGFDAAQNRVAEAIADESFPIEGIPYLLTHTAYHTGQIMQLRAMQGLPPIE